MEPIRTGWHVVGLCMIWVAMVGAAVAQAGRVSIPDDKAGIEITGAITGEGITTYVVQALSGQVLSVDMQTTNGANYFNILPLGSDVAIHAGASDGNVADLSVPENGNYSVEIFLMRSAARRNETADYVLTLSLHGDEVSAALAAGPDYWRVEGVRGGDLLNVRSGPSTRYPVTGKVQNGDLLRNDGCRLTLDEHWCRIRATGLGTTGWVSARYLTEAAAPRMPDMPQGGPKGNGTPFDATGSIPCMIAGGVGSGVCIFGVIREGVGNAGVWIATGDGAERQILFENYVPVTISPWAEFTHDLDGDTIVIGIGATEFRIPRAVIDGG